MSFDGDQDRNYGIQSSEIDQKEKEQLDSPKTVEHIQANLRQEIQMRKVKNEANQQLARFKKCLQKQDAGNQIATATEKISVLPLNLQNELEEAVLYAYFAVRYYDEHIFKIILTRTNRFANDKELQVVLGKDRSFNTLTQDSSYSRFRLNQIAFENALDKDYVDIAFHFIETGQVHITWDMIRKMIDRRQEYLVKQCIKYGSKFDPGSACLKKIVFAGRTAAPLEDRTIKLVDFIQVMLELKWKTKEIQEVLKNYSKRGKIDPLDMREMFLMFAVKRKTKLMSFMVNDDDFQMEFQEANFIDVIENDAYEIGVLLYREYFLQINNQYDKINSLLVNAFSKTNGLIEAKCFLTKRFMPKMSFEQAVKLIEAIEARVFDSSKGNLLILTLNVVKASCLLIEILEKVKRNFGFLSRRIQEIRQKIIKIAQAFMDDVQTEEEMSFFLLEKDLDERDALNIIYDYDVVDLLEHPFAQNIVQQIWSSQYNNSHSLFTVSSVHTLLFNYNHCMYDEEENLRFYKKKDLAKYSCHGFQFQVWRFSAQSRYLVSTITYWLFCIWLHILMVRQMSRNLYLFDNQDEISLTRQAAEDPDSLQSQFTPAQIAIQQDIFNMWNQRIFEFKERALELTYLMLLGFLFMVQHIFETIFATKNKRTVHLVNLNNFMDYLIFQVGLIYIIIVYKVWLYDTFLKYRPELEEAMVFWDQYRASNINENALLLTYGLVLWLKAFYQLKLLPFVGILYVVMTKVAKEMIIFALFYFAQLFLFAIIGFVLFSDLPGFNTLNSALFTLFNTTIQVYDVDQMQYSRISAFLGYLYFIVFLLLNLILIVNLIVGQLAYAYKQYSKKRDILMLLSTLSIREVSEADEKYSAVVSSPFPLSLANFLFAGILFGTKSIGLNIFVLNLYYLPIFVVILVLFVVYQVVALPFCYVKIAGHKFALMVKTPQGQGASGSFDRGFQALVFIVFGPLILSLNCIVDIYWFIRHTYKMDLDKSHLQVQQTTDIHRRTYKKMYKYFEQKNEQLVPQKRVAEDLRKYLDVMEGLRCIIYGKPKEIPSDKVGFYIAYAQKFIKESSGKKSDSILKEEAAEADDYAVEQVVKEFEVVKQVLLNNSFPVDMREIQHNNVKKKGWGMRILFDKKTFFSLLQDLERMRKILNLKKSFYIFHIPYEGKPQEMNKWHKKVEARMTQTLKFLNTSRLLRIIGYDPSYQIKPENINLARGISQKIINMDSPQKRGIPTGASPQIIKKGSDDQLKLNQITLDNSFQKAYQSQASQHPSRVDHLHQNMQFMMSKYSNASKQVKELAEIMKKLNFSNQQLSGKEYQHLQNKGTLNSQNAGASSLMNKNEQKKSSLVEDCEVQQTQVNYYSPSKYGVINQPVVELKRSEHKSNREKQLNNSVSEAIFTSESEGPGANKADINNFVYKKK